MGYHQGLEQGLGLHNPFNPVFPNSELIRHGNDFDVAADIPYSMLHNTTQPEGTIQRSTLGGDDRTAGDSRKPRSAMGEAHLRDDNWTYAIEVSPAIDLLPGHHFVKNHVAALHKHLTKRSIDYDYALAQPVEGSGICRQYTLKQKDRFNDRVRLEFLQVFTANRPYNRQLPNYSIKMSVVFKDRTVLPSGPYPPGIDDRQDQEGESRFSPGPSIHGLVGYSAGDEQVLLPVSPSSNGLDSPSPFDQPLSPPESLSTPGHRHHTRPPRLGPIVKPNRIANKNREGKFVCSFAGCTDDVKVFSRKCEWSKHMDKHDRPYKCLSSGCEKLAGFTYSGGLLRHEREVHNKHGGPKNPLNCPHGNCKRHEGKGFSRMENLNEHLRRVHTPSDANNGPTVVELPEDELEENPAPLQQVVAPEKIGEKRKPETDLREEVKRLHQENQQLRNEVRAQSLHSMAMMQTIEEINLQLRELANSKSQLQLQSESQSRLQPQPQPQPQPQLELQSEVQSEAQSDTEPDLDVAQHTGLSSLG
ncbi:hypothetical protein GL218_05845 [Daldinia childiae]|uniref:uncharacterized protein n=1 Tax=Daldinia childiae TaxID=326645 RepID=UPI00144774BD|nr:uncharacterized protein GL218_05845 [Daldinia childiae]KAF3058245.1 hypothetical protein GL218_05845 [Daldinia childiae]